MNRTDATTAAPATDELELTLETLKDLTVSLRDADGVRGGRTSSQMACYCGTA